MKLKEEYCGLVKKHLENLSIQFEAELIAVCNIELAEDVKFLRVEYDSSTFSDRFSVYMYAISNKETIIGDVFWFLKDEVVVPADIYESEKYEEIEPWHTASIILEAWLMDRWTNSGNIKYPTYLAHHDSYYMRNMQTGAKINSDEITNGALK